MKHVEIKEVVRMYSDGIATSYTQLINIIAKSDDIEGVKKRIEYLTEFSVVLEFFALKLDRNSLIVWQRDTDENLIEILTVKFSKDEQH